MSSDNKNAKNSKEHSAQDALAEYRGDLKGAERRIAGRVVLGRYMPLMVFGFLVPLVMIFLPHAGDVRGYDVLFNTPVAQDGATAKPEVIFSWLRLVAILLTIGTLVSKSWIVAWVNWAFAGVAWWYNVFAIWVRQTQPPTETGDGPSIPLLFSLVGLTVLFYALSAVVFQKNPLQRALAAARREEAHRDEESRMAQQRLRTGIEDREEAEIVDDRRARAKARRERKAELEKQEGEPQQETEES